MFYVTPGRGWFWSAVTRKSWVNSLSNVAVEVSGSQVNAHATAVSGSRSPMAAGLLSPERPIVVLSAAVLEGDRITVRVPVAQCDGLLRAALSWGCGIHAVEPSR